MTLPAYDWVEYYAGVTPNKLAMRDLTSGRDFTYAQMHERVARVAGLLREKGVQPGDRVGYICFNTTDIMELVFGCWRIGAICLALNYRLTPPELSFILNNAEADTVLVDTAFSDLAEAVKPDVKTRHWIFTDGMGGVNDYETALGVATPIYNFHPQSLKDQCLLMYSSGTTGAPKGVIITHAMIEFSNVSIMHLAEYSKNDVALNNMPLFHIGALNITALPSIWGGRTSVFMRMFDPAETIKVISDPDIGITAIMQVPAAYNALRLHPDAEKGDFSRLRTVFCGAEAVPKALIHWWLEKGVVVQEGYGMTETAAAGTILPKADIPERIGSAGRPLLHSRIKIVNEDGQDVPRGTAGEIWFKGLAITPGYWRNPDANAKSFTDGWFRSGDIGVMDKDGYISIEDRLKDMYISGGENVYPAEIESLLYELPQIAEVAVIGVPDERWGETGCVVAVLRADTTLSLNDIHAHMQGRAAKFKLPNYLQVLDILPRGGTGKVLKFQLRKTAAKSLGLNAEA